MRRTCHVFLYFSHIVFRYFWGQFNSHCPACITNLTLNVIVIILHDIFITMRTITINTTVRHIFKAKQIYRGIHVCILSRLVIGHLFFSYYRLMLMECRQPCYLEDVRPSQLPWKILEAKKVGINTDCYT